MVREMGMVEIRICVRAEDDGRFSIGVMADRTQGVGTLEERMVSVMICDWLEEWIKGKVRKDPRSTFETMRVENATEEQKARMEEKYWGGKGGGSGQ